MYAYASSSTRAEYVRNTLCVATRVHMLNTLTNAHMWWTPQVSTLPEQTHVHTHHNKQTLISKWSASRWTAHAALRTLCELRFVQHSCECCQLRKQWSYESRCMRSKKSGSRNSMMPPPKFASDLIAHDTSTRLLPHFACFRTWFSGKWLDLNSSCESEKTTTTSSPSAVLQSPILRIGLHSNVQRQTSPHSLWEYCHH